MMLSDVGVLWSLLLQGLLWLAKPGVVMPALGLVALVLLLRRPAQPGRRLGLWGAVVLLLAPVVGMLLDVTLMLLFSVIGNDTALMAILIGAFGWGEILLLAGAALLLGHGLAQALAAAAGEPA